MYIAKNMGKSLSNKHAATSATNVAQKRLDSAKKSATDTIKKASKRAIQKTAEVTGDLIGNKIADKTTSVSKRPNNENNNNDDDNKYVEIATHKKRYISPEEIQKIINKLRLVPKKDEYF